jgi:hypothetical protein
MPDTGKTISLHVPNAPSTQSVNRIVEIREALFGNFLRALLELRLVRVRKTRPFCGQDC